MQIPLLFNVGVGVDAELQFVWGGGGAKYLSRYLNWRVSRWINGFDKIFGSYLIISYYFNSIT